MFVSNVPVEGKEGGLPQGTIQFHFDQCYYERPAKATLLYAIDVLLCWNSDKRNGTLVPTIAFHSV